MHFLYLCFLHDYVLRWSKFTWSQLSRTYMYPFSISKESGFNSSQFYSLPFSLPFTELWLLRLLMTIKTTYFFISLLAFYYIFFRSFDNSTALSNAYTYTVQRWFSCVIFYDLTFLPTTFNVKRLLHIRWLFRLLLYIYWWLWWRWVHIVVIFYFRQPRW